MCSLVMTDYAISYLNAHRTSNMYLHMDSAHSSTMNNHVTHGGPLRNIGSHCVHPSVYRIGVTFAFLDS